MRIEPPLLNEETRMYLRDCYDHCVQIMDLLETYRDMATSMLDVYWSSMSLHTNEIMRVLTLIATIFIPLTFIVGVYGMNFSHATSRGRCPSCIGTTATRCSGCMLALVAGLLFFFKRRPGSKPQYLVPNAHHTPQHLGSVRFPMSSSNHGFKLYTACADTGACIEKCLNNYT